jgi:Dyp-type peroxidase family
MSSDTHDHHDIQGLVRGFGTRWPWATFIFGTLPDDAAGNRNFLTTLPAVLQGEDVSEPTSVALLDASADDSDFDCAFNVAFTFRGLAKLGINPDVLYSFADDYMQGMAARADINGDDRRSSPRYWEEHWRERKVDVWIGVYARTAERREEQVQRLGQHFVACGIAECGRDQAHRFVSDATAVWIDDPSTQPDPGNVLEHFGFRDGISNPPIRGLIKDPVETAGAGKLDKDGRWHPLAAGEFLYGYSDEIGEVPRGPMPPTIARNGTYLVYRKLCQNVDCFRQYVTHTANRYGLRADHLAEKMVGRRRNGEALTDSPPRGDRINDFVFGDDTKGLRCPLGSHVRRANPRDTLGFQTLLVDRHRILRRAIPYGKLVPRGVSQDDVNGTVTAAGESFPGQGLLFIALNIDITRQFEFVQSEWVNFGNDLNQGSDRDPIVGSHDADSERSRMIFPNNGDNPVVVCSGLPRFVETRGGDYFFLPGIAAYRAIVRNDFS